MTILHVITGVSNGGAEAVLYRLVTHSSEHRPRCPSSETILPPIHGCHFTRRMRPVHARLRIPKMIPHALVVAACALPLGRLRDVIDHQYGKYCGRNLYSTDRLHASGFAASPHLLTLAGAARRDVNPGWGA